MNASVKYWLSTAERAARAFAVSFVSVYIAGGLSIATFSNASLAEKAADAGLATLGSLILSLVGGNIGNQTTPSLLPRKLDPATKQMQWVGERGPELIRKPKPRALGRNVNHDPRSRHYALPEAGPVVAQNWTRRAPIFDQGQLGSCTGNAAAGWLTTDDASRQGMTALPDGTAVDEKLAVSIYSDATKIDTAKGSYPPTDTGSDGLSVAKVLQTRGLCGSYQHAFSINAVYVALQTGPGMAGTVWYNSMFNTAADGHIVVDKSSGEAGGHEYVIRGFEVSAGNVTKIWMDNSWGQSWGVNGSGYFTEAEFTALLAADGDFTVPIPVSAAPPAPPAPPAPVTSEPFLESVAKFPKLGPKLAANAAAHQMTVDDFSAWKLAGDYKAR